MVDDGIIVHDDLFLLYTYFNVGVVVHPALTKSIKQASLINP